MKRRGHCERADIASGIVEPRTVLVPPPHIQDQDAEAFMVWVNSYLQKHPLLARVEIFYLNFRFIVTRGGKVEAIDAGHPLFQDAPALARNLYRLLKKARSATR